MNMDVEPEVRGHGISRESKRSGLAESRSPAAFQMTILPYEGRDLLDIAGNRSPWWASAF